MSVSSIVAIAVIVILSVAAVLTAEEPLDEVFHIRAAMEGFPLPPLATKVAQRSDAEMNNGDGGVCSSESLVPSPLKRAAYCGGPAKTEPYADGEGIAVEQQPRHIGHRARLNQA